VKCPFVEARVTIIISDTMYTSYQKATVSTIIAMFSLEEKVLTYLFFLLSQRTRRNSQPIMFGDRVCHYSCDLNFLTNSLEYAQEYLDTCLKIQCHVHQISKSKCPFHKDYDIPLESRNPTIAFYKKQKPYVDFNNALFSNWPNVSNYCCLKSLFTYIKTNLLAIFQSIHQKSESMAPFQLCSHVTSISTTVRISGEFYQGVLVRISQDRVPVTPVFSHLKHGDVARLSYRIISRKVQRG
jgi:hypothetical protein